MTETVSPRAAMPLFWLAAGASIAIIVTLAGAVLLVKPVPMTAQLPPLVSKSAEIASLRAPIEVTTVSNVPALRPRIDEVTENLVIDVSPTPAPSPSVVADLAMPIMANLAGPIERASSASVSTAVVTSPTPMPDAPLVAKPPAAKPPLVRTPAAPITTREVETVVVTGQSYQQAAFSVDNIGRGNSLVIQLPRAKPD